MPSFVSTLAGLLAVLGLQLYLLGATGSINLPYGSPAGEPRADAGHAARGGLRRWCWSAGIAIFITGSRHAAQRRAAGLSPPSLAGIAARALVFIVAVEFAVYYLNRDRGVPWMFGLFVGLVVAMDYALTPHPLGPLDDRGRRQPRSGTARRHQCARASTPAPSCCAPRLAALGGVLSAARLASASQQAGTGDVNLNAIAAAVIGGTSLFGGRGSAYSALLGIIVIQAIASGLTLLDLSSSLRYMITGGVLAIAVIVDSLARRSRVSHGRA